MAKRRHRTAYQQSTAALEREGRKLTGIDVADSTTKKREEKAG